MGVSRHSQEYLDMRDGIIDAIVSYMGCSGEEAMGLWDELAPIMNDYGAVSWT